MKSLIIPTRKELIDTQELIYSSNLLQKAPIENVYLILQRNEFEDLPVFVQNAEPQQIAAVFYLHSWIKDSIDISKFFDLISILLDQPELLIKAVASVDISYLALAILSEAQLKIFDEKIEFLDEDNSFTIDGGYTWVVLRSQDPDRCMLLRKLVDFLTGTKDLLKNLLFSSNLTPSELWEEAKNHREEIYSNFELPPEDLRREILEGVHFPASYALNISNLPVETDSELQWYPVYEVLKRVDLSIARPLLRNIFFSIVIEEGLALDDLDQLKDVETYVLATINIGLQKKLSAGFSIEDLLDPVVIKEAFRIGIHDVRFFRQKFSGVNTEHWSTEIKAVKDALLDFPPRLPSYFSELGLAHTGHSYLTDLVFISHLGQLKALKKLLTEIKSSN